MKKILIFSGSNSSKSINRKLAEYAGSLIKDHLTKTITLSDFDIPIYSEDLEREGFPSGVKELHKIITDVDGLIISVPEHNGNLPAFFKNILDWLSRFDRYFLSGIKILLLSTSPGGRGGSSSLESTQKIIPYFKGEITGTFSLKYFTKNFSGIVTDDNKNTELKELIKKFSKNL